MAQGVCCRDIWHWGLPDRHQLAGNWPIGGTDGLVGVMLITLRQQLARSLATCVAQLAGPEMTGSELQVIKSVWIGRDGHLCALNGDACQELRPSVLVLSVVLAGELVIGKVLA